MKMKKRKLFLVLGTVLLFGIVFYAGEYRQIHDSGPAEVKTGSRKNDTDTKNDTNKDTKKTTTLLFTGDVEISPYVQKNYTDGGIDKVIDPTLKKELTDADILEVNNEFSYSERGTPESDKQYTFRVNPSYVTILSQMGVDVAGLANNHVLDYGKEALTDTCTTLANAKIAYTGAGKDIEEAQQLVTIEKNGKKYGFLAASRVIPKGSWDVKNSQPGVFSAYDTTDLLQKIQEAKKSCDYVFVCIHWGTEHTTTLTPYQPVMAHAMIDAGADAVIGSHSHCLQGIEYYHGKPVFYSLGNFIFNQTIDQTIAVKMVVTETGIQPVLLGAYAADATTYPADSTKKRQIYGLLEQLSPGISIDENGVMTQK